MEGILISHAWRTLGSSPADPISPSRQFEDRPCGPRCALAAAEARVLDLAWHGRSHPLSPTTVFDGRGARVWTPWLAAVRCGGLLCGRAARCPARPDAAGGVAGLRAG